MHTSGVDRRTFLAFALGAGGVVASHEAFADILLKDIADLKPGQFLWNPERSTVGPVSVVVSIPEQRVHVYRNGVRIAVSTCSTGRPGHATPTGVFVVLEKDKMHFSSIYDDAPMPNMNRLTWSGIAMHAGQLPGYPASHGCVRLPMAFSSLLYTVTHVGTPVIIAGAVSDPWELTHPGMVLAGYAEQEFEQVLKGLDGKKLPADWQAAEQAPVTTLIVSSADKKCELIENDRVVATGDVSLSGGDKFGSSVLVLNGADADGKGMRWTVIGHGEEGAQLAKDGDILKRLGAAPDFVAAVQAKMHPGMIMVLTDAPLTPDRRSGKDFVIVSSTWQPNAAAAPAAPRPAKPTAPAPAKAAPAATPQPVAPADPAR